MRRKLNVKLVFGLLGGLLLTAVSVHFLHGYQLGRNAYRLLERGDLAREAKEYEKAQTFYAHYLTFVPNDPDTVQKYAEVLDRLAQPGADRVQLVKLMEQVLRVKPQEHAFRFRLVHNLIAHDRITDAMEHLRRLEGHWQDRAELLHMIGWCQDAKKDYTQALRTYEEAIRLKPQQLKTYPLLMEIYQDRVGQPDEAQKVIESMVRNNADAYGAYLARAQFYRRRGDEKAAWKDLEQAYQLGKDQPEVILAMVEAAFARGDWKRAIQLLETGIGRVPLPERAALQIALADILARQGDPGRAEKLVRDVAQALPLDLVSRGWLFELALQRNQLAPARDWLNEIHGIEGDQGKLARYGEAALLVLEARSRPRRREEARRALNQLDPSQKLWPNVVALWGTLHELDGNHVDAIKEYSRALQLGATQPRVLASVVGLLLHRGEFQKAENEFAQYEQKQPLTKELARLGAEVALALREKAYGKIALQRARQAVTLPARDFREALWLARIYHTAGEIAEAEALLRTSLDQAGHAPDVWIAWMEFLESQDRRPEALSQLERLKKEVAPGRLPLTLARCFESLHLVAEASKAYEDALRLAPDDFSVLAYAADYYREMDHLDQAQRCYERLLDPALAVPGNTAAKARRHLAIVLGQRGSAARAVTLLDENHKDHGDNVADQRVRLYLQCLTPAKCAAAITQFQDTRRAQVLSTDERLLLADMFESATRLGEARRQLAELDSAYPNTPRTLVRLARLLIRMDDLDEAKQLIMRLETLEPRSDRVAEVRQLLARALPK